MGRRALMSALLVGALASLLVALLAGLHRNPSAPHTPQQAAAAAAAPVRAKFDGIFVTRGRNMASMISLTELEDGTAQCEWSQFVINQQSKVVRQRVLFEGRAEGDALQLFTVLNEGKTPLRVRAVVSWAGNEVDFSVVHGEHTLFSGTYVPSNVQTYTTFVEELRLQASRLREDMEKARIRAAAAPATFEDIVREANEHSASISEFVDGSARAARRFSQSTKQMEDYIANIGRAAGAEHLWLRDQLRISMTGIKNASDGLHHEHEEFATYYNGPVAAFRARLAEQKKGCKGGGKDALPCDAFDKLESALSRDEAKIKKALEELADIYREESAKQESLLAKAQAMQ